MAFSKQQEKEGVELAVKSGGWTDSGHQYHPHHDQPISYSQAKTAANSPEKNDQETVADVPES